MGRTPSTAPHSGDHGTVWIASFPSRTAAARVTGDLDDGLGLRPRLAPLRGAGPALEVLVPVRELSIVLDVVGIHGGRVEGLSAQTDRRDRHRPLPDGSAGPGASGVHSRPGRP